MRLKISFILPTILWLAILSVFPLVYSIYVSLTDLSLLPIARTTFIGLQNYLRAFTDEYFLSSLRISGLFTAGALTIEFFLGLGGALLLYRRFCGRAVARTLTILPLIVTSVVIGLVWKILYNTQYGLINYISRELSLPVFPWLTSVQTVLISIIIVDVWQWTPLVILIILSGLESLPREPFESAHMDGASNIQIFYYLTLPMLRPVMLVALLIRFMDTIRIFDTIYVLTKGGPGGSTEVISLYIYRSVFRHLDVGYACALSWVTLAIIIFASQIFLRSILKSFR